MQTIVAVAIGEGFLTFPIRSNSDLKDAGSRKVRRYLHGLVSGLNRRGYRFGTGAANPKHFVIDFRLVDASNLGSPGTFKDASGNNPQVIFGMSTAVVKAAGVQLPGVPIVGVVSDPAGEGLNADPYCGISAQRIQTAGDCFNNFRLPVPSLNKIYVLGNSASSVSNSALAKVDAAAKAASFAIASVDVTSFTSFEQTLKNQLPPPRDVTDPCLNGLLVLPVDMFLSKATDIIRIAQKNRGMPAFLPVPDWVKGTKSSALGAYGVSQKRCGVLMAKQVASVFNGTIPQDANRWLPAAEDDFDFATSQPAATALNITLGPDIPPSEE